MRLRDGRSTNLYGLTEEYIQAKYWDNKAHGIKSGTGYSREGSLTTVLNKIKTHIEEKYFDDKKIESINKEWLKEALELYYHPEKGYVRLQPAHPTMAPIYVRHGDDRSFEIVGQVVGVFRKLS